MNLKMNEEIDEFLDRVESVTAKVRGVLNGTIDVKELEKEEQKLKLEKRASEIRKEEQKEKERKQFEIGREGRGDEEECKFFCPFCLVLYEYELKKCKRCDRDVITKEERKKQLEDKVKKYKEAKKNRDERRKLWNEWKNNKGEQNKKEVDGYEKWDKYEPSSDSFDEDERNLRYLPKHDKNFELLEKRMDADIKKRHEAKTIAVQFKDQGNEYFKNKNYLAAISCYKNGIDVSKDYLELYTNVALCEIKVYQYEHAIEHCNKVIEYYEIFKDDLKIKKDTVFKAFARKGLSLFHLNQMKESLESFQQALLLFPEDKETIRYISKCEQRLKEQSRVYEMLEEPVELNKNSKSNLKEEEEKNNLCILKKLSQMKIDEIKTLTTEELKMLYKKSQKEPSVKSWTCTNLFECEETKKKVSFLSILIKEMNETVRNIKKEMEGDILNETVMKPINFQKTTTLFQVERTRCTIILDFLLEILEDKKYHIDMCVEATRAILTFYMLHFLTPYKCLWFLSDICMTFEGRKKFLHITTGSPLVIEKMFCSLKEYTIYHEEKQKKGKMKDITLERLHYCFSEDKERKQLENNNIYGTNGGGTLTKLTEEKEKEGLLLFDLLTNACSDSLFRKFVIEHNEESIIFLISFVTNQMRNPRGMYKNYLSFLINISQHPQMRITVIKECWDQLYIFLQETTDDECTEYALALLSNLTHSWTQELQENKKIHCMDTIYEIKEKEINSIAKYTRSNHMPTVKLSFIILLRLYLYTYHQQKDREKRNELSTDIANKNENICEEPNGLNKEYELILNPQTCSFLIYSMDTVFKKRQDDSILLACVNLLSVFLKCTNFFSLVVQTNVSFISTMIEQSLFLFQKYLTEFTGEKKVDHTVALSNLIVYFSEVLKKIRTSKYNNEPMLKKLQGLLIQLVKISDTPHKCLRKNVHICLANFSVIPFFRSKVEEMHVKQLLLQTTMVSK